jgi:outer membrane protein OmpA-like peptidoglycan-associated protein
MSVNKLNKSTNKKVTVTQNIAYASGQFTLAENSLKIVDEIKVLLENNSAMKLEVISHTDSQGDDNDNLELSIKRSTAVVDYLVLKGIDKSRLTATGKGEKEIRNRCKNDIDCSKKEHAFNRRTEFHFIK